MDEHPGCLLYCVSFCGQVSSYNPDRTLMLLDAALLSSHFYYQAQEGGIKAI